MSQVASQGGRGGVANARFAGFPVGQAGGQIMQQQCAFPAPPPRRVYCMPAPFTQQDGRAHHRLVTAYGQARPYVGQF